MGGALHGEEQACLVVEHLDQRACGGEPVARNPDEEEANQRMDTGEYDEVVDLPRQIYQSNNQATSSHSKGVIFHVNNQAKDSVQRRSKGRDLIILMDLFIVYTI